ncbi:MCE family protein [Mycobacterium sp.]|uniref:MCE family protein n=1 Tax=Mycobacterium sp. TaxID=1785 RepID=UPI002DAC1C1F|nr:MCE family protein [Mycobacterium sp.]
MADKRKRALHPAWWTAIFLAVVVIWCAAVLTLFSGTFREFVPVTLTSDRAGLVMESGGKVKMRGVEVGRVATVSHGTDAVSLKLEIYPDKINYIPANVGAQIRATTAFGAKYVDLIEPEHPSAARLSSGAVLESRNVSTEVNTVFQNLVGVIKKIDPAKFNATLAALAEGVRGQGQAIGAATTDANQVLLALNPRMDTVAQDIRAFTDFNDTYSAAAQDILAILDAASTTSTTLTNHASELDALLLNVTGLARSGIDLLGPAKDNLIRAVNVLQPTTDLLYKYNPEYTCLLMGAKWWLDNGAYTAVGGNGKTSILDAGITFGDDPYRYPENLPIIAAKGGPGGKPGCGSLPDATKNFPVRQLITNTGWGTGLDVRPNPGIGFPGWANYLPVTRAVPEAPSIRYPGGPAPGPAPAYPGGPPYGAPEYGPDGTPLYPPPPGAPPPAP